MSHAAKLTVANYREFKEYPEIFAAVSRILARQCFVAPVELFVEMDLLPAADLERWKRGQIPVLERVIRYNLTRAGRILRLLRFHASSLRSLPINTAATACASPAAENPRLRKPMPRIWWWSGNTTPSPLLKLIRMVRFQSEQAGTARHQFAGLPLWCPKSPGIFTYSNTKFEDAVQTAERIWKRVNSRPSNS